MTLLDFSLKDSEFLRLPQKPQLPDPGFQGENHGVPPSRRQQTLLCLLTDNTPQRAGSEPTPNHQTIVLPSKLPREPSSNINFGVPLHCGQPQSKASCRWPFPHAAQIHVPIIKGTHGLFTHYHIQLLAFLLPIFQGK